MDNRIRFIPDEGVETPEVCRFEVDLLESDAVGSKRWHMLNFDEEELVCVVQRHLGDSNPVGYIKI